jgi:hypothetical protein
VRSQRRTDCSRWSRLHNHIEATKPGRRRDAQGCPVVSMARLASGAQFNKLPHVALLSNEHYFSAASFFTVSSRFLPCSPEATISNCSLST